MTVISGFDDCLGFMNARISSFSINEKQNEIIVDIIDGVDAYSPHPLHTSFSSEDPCRIVFKDVKYIVKKTSFYTEKDGKLFAEPPVEEKFQFSLNSDIVTMALGIEGVLVDQNKTNLAWIDCEIQAKDILFDDLK